jgi:hypothetical protein
MSLSVGKKTGFSMLEGLLATSEESSSNISCTLDLRFFEAKEILDSSLFGRS